MDLKYLIRHSENKENSPSIFLLHGYGSNMSDLTSICEYINSNNYLNLSRVQLNQLVRALFIINF